MTFPAAGADVADATALADALLDVTVVDSALLVAALLVVVASADDTLATLEAVVLAALAVDALAALAVEALAAGALTVDTTDAVAELAGAALDDVAATVAEPPQAASKPLAPAMASADATKRRRDTTSLLERGMSRTPYPMHRHPMGHWRRRGGARR